MCAQKTQETINTFENIHTDSIGDVIISKISRGQCGCVHRTTPLARIVHYNIKNFGAIRSFFLYMIFFLKRQSENFLSRFQSLKYEKKFV